MVKRKRKKTIKKPHITFFHCSFIYRGGGERIVMEEVMGLRNRGYQVEVFAPIFDKKNCYPDIINEVQVKTLLPQLPNWFPLKYAWILLLSCLIAPFFAPRFVTTDIFVGANQPGAYLAWVMSKILRKPYLVFFNHPNRILYPRNGETWHTVSDFYFLDKLLRFFKAPFAWLDKISFSQGSVALTNGFFIASEIEKIYQLRTKPCPSGSPFLNQKDLPSKLAAFDGNLQINGFTIPKPYLLFTGRHESWKKIDWAIKSLPKVLKSYPKVSLVIPGPFTPYTKKLAHLAKQLQVEDKVFLVGEINQQQLETLYEQAAIYVFPSEKEDFGVVVLEAMGNAVPVVAWNIAGPTDSVVDGKTGFLAKPYDLNDFASKIVLLLKNPDRRLMMGTAAHSHVRNNFCWNKHLDILEKEILATFLGVGNEAVASEPI